MSARADLTLFDAPRRPGRPRKVTVAGRFREALAASTRLIGEDAAVVEVGRRLAAEIDAADDPKLVATLSAQLLAVTDRLGLSPKGRRYLKEMELGAGAAPVDVGEVNPLAELALIRQSRRASGDDAGV